MITDLPIELMERNAGRAAAMLRLLGHEKRLMVLCRLADGEMPVGALQALVGLSQSALSQHLARLREDGLVAGRRDGTTIHYRIADPNVLRIMGVLADIYCHPDEKGQADAND